MVPGEIIVAEESSDLPRQYWPRNEKDRGGQHRGTVPSRWEAITISTKPTRHCALIARRPAVSRLNIAAGTAVRFEPGDTKEVEIVALAGSREVYGLNNKVDGPL